MDFFRKHVSTETLAKNLGNEELVCYSDSLLCINLIKDQTPRFHVYAILIQYVKYLTEQSNIIVCHILKEENQCADFLAKLGASSDNDLVYHASPPDGLLYRLKMDAFGTFFPRE